MERYSEKMLSTKQVASLLGTNIRHTRALIKQGVLSGKKVGAFWRIHPDDVYRLVANSESSGDKFFS